MIVIDSEFQSLIPPLSDDEYQRLEKSMLTDGFHEWEPIVTWNGTIVDGHNRYHICDKHGIKPKQVEREFESRDAAKIWIIEHQLGRRNLNVSQIAALTIDKEEAEVREQARLRQVQAGKENGKGMNNSLTSKEDKLSQNAEQPPIEPKPKGRTVAILAEKAGVGQSTIERALKVKREDPELYKKIRDGEITAGAACKQVIGKQEKKHSKAPTTRKKAEYTDDGRRICSVCNEPIDEGDYYACKPSVHKSCCNQRARDGRYKNPDKSLLENVATYTTQSLVEELASTAERMKEAISESIAINESMGVYLTNAQKRRISKALDNVMSAILDIRGC